MTISLTSSNQ